MAPTIDAVIPAHNEAPFIGAVLRAIPAGIRRIFVIDDGSSDGTSEAIPSARVVMLRNEVNLGVGASVVRGYREFLRRGGDIVVTLDADGQMDPREIPRLVAPLLEGRADYVKGDRISGNGHAGTMPPVRRIANAGLSMVTHFAGGTPRLSDTQCGYTAITAATLRRLDLDAITPRYGYVNDVLIQLARLRCRIETVCVRTTYGDEVSDVQALQTCFGMSGIFLRGFLKRAFAL